jgi:ornithine cyclodeaminase/alanine dehydrogenase-like protein (mu-crystallin family)
LLVNSIVKVQTASGQHSSPNAAGNPVRNDTDESRYNQHYGSSLDAAGESESWVTRFDQPKDCQVSYLLITDDDIAKHLSMPQAVTCMEETLRLHAEGTLIAPARSDSDLAGAGKLVFTVGGSTGENSLVGFRAYDATHFKSPARDELVAVFCGNTGAIKALVAGTQLGPIRTGAIGGVAVKYLSRSDSKVLGLIGTGPQGKTQLQAATAVRQFDQIKVFSRDAERCREFAEQMSKELGQPVQAAATAREAVEEADVLITATISPTPIIQADWLKPDVHINNVGPKFKNNQELDLSVAERAALLVTDTLAQVEKCGDEFITVATPLHNRLQELAPFVTGSAARERTSEEITLFYSLGLAGTEVTLAALVADQMTTQA